MARRPGDDGRDQTKSGSYRRSARKLLWNCIAHSGCVRATRI